MGQGGGMTFRMIQDSQRRNLNMYDHEHKGQIRTSLAEYVDLAMHRAETTTSSAKRDVWLQVATELDNLCRGFQS